MDLTTTWLGLTLPHPILPGAGPLCDDLDGARRLEDAGAAALVLRSLFEEQLTNEQLGAHVYEDHHAEANPEALTYQPEPPRFALGPNRYLEHVRALKEATDLPVIASLNGVTEGGWIEHARLIEQAGADALELNTYSLSTSLDESAAVIEDRVVRILMRVKKEVRMPVAVKLSPFYSALPHLTKRLADAGADGLVLFNRFYQADLDVEELDVTRTLRLSDSSELLLRVRWLAVLSGRVPLGLACSGGVHTTVDALKAVMAGADVVQLVSAVLTHGPATIGKLKDGLSAWLTEHEYESLAQAKGSLSLLKCPDPKAYERAQYVDILSSWARPTR